MIAELPEDINLQTPTKGSPPPWFNPYFNPAIYTAERVVFNGMERFGEETKKDAQKDSKEVKKEPKKEVQLVPGGAKVKPTAPSLITPKSEMPKVGVVPPKPTAPPTIRPRPVVKKPEPAPKVAAKPSPAIPREPVKAPPPRIKTPEIKKTVVPPLSKGTQTFENKIQKMRPPISKKVPKEAPEYTSVKPQSTMFAPETSSYGYGGLGGFGNWNQPLTWIAVGLVAWYLLKK